MDRSDQALEALNKLKVISFDLENEKNILYPEAKRSVYEIIKKFSICPDYIQNNTPPHIHNLRKNIDNLKKYIALLEDAAKTLCDMKFEADNSNFNEGEIK